MTSGPVFVLGTGRCGSTLVHELLARHPGTTFLSNVDDRLGRTTALTPRNGALHRRLPPGATRKGRVRFAPSEGYRILERRVSPLVVDPCRDLTADDAMPWLVARLRRLFAPLDRSGAVVLHKLTGWPRLGLLLAAFPDARVIHVVRDGRAVAASWVQMPWWRGHLGPEGWHFGPLPADGLAAWEASGRSMPLLAGLGWRLLIDAFDATSAGLPSTTYRAVRYEDVVADPGTHLDELARFAGLGSHPDLDDAVRRTTFDRTRLDSYRAALDPADVTRLDEVLGLSLARHGYPTPVRVP